MGTTCGRSEAESLDAPSTARGIEHAMVGWRVQRGTLYGSSFKNHRRSASMCAHVSGAHSARLQALLHALDIHPRGSRRLAA